MKYVKKEEVTYVARDIKILKSIFLICSLVKGQCTDGIFAIIKGDDKYEDGVKQKFNCLFILDTITNIISVIDKKIFKYCYKTRSRFYC